MKIFVSIFLLLIWSCVISGTFILDFQSTVNLSTEEWAEYTGKIPPMNEFTSCLWEKLRKFASDYTAVWGYCKQKSNACLTIQILHELFNNKYMDSIVATDTYVFVQSVKCILF